MPVSPRKSSARSASARAIATAARSFPDIDAQSIEAESLDPREARLALAIHRTVLQRWLTIEYLLNGYLRKPMRTLEPALQGILLTAGAQLLFMDRLPAHAVVDESVKLARVMVREGASGLVNAVLRRISELPDAAVRGKPWQPAVDRLPLEDGYVPLRDACLPDLPDPVDDAAQDAESLRLLEHHLSIVTSHPVPLVRRWIKEHGVAGAIALCEHGIRTPPVVVAMETELDAAAPPPEHCERSAYPGFLHWQGAHADLTALLRGHPARRVQDVTAAKAVGELRGLAEGELKVIVDYCAGKGTKTRQLASVFPESTIIATDADDERRGVLRGAFAGHERVRVTSLNEVRQAVAAESNAGADALLLDVPCTNTGVLPRRPEARYRFNEATLKSLVRLQRGIVEQSLPLLKPGGLLVYSTCSVDHAENQAQVKWILEHHECQLLRETLTLPGGSAAAYHDGGYLAVLRKTQS